MKADLLVHRYLRTLSDYRTSSPTELFESAWKCHCDDILLRKEYLFAYPRKFKADYAHVKSKVLIDIQGGVHRRGNSGHSSGKGIIRDCEKLMYAQMLGYRMFYLPKELITSDNILMIRNCILGI